jgi:MFS family permease
MEIAMNEDIPAHTPVHPFLFTILIVPMGALSGYVSVTLGYLLSKAGIPVAAIAALIGSMFIPHILKFIWAPIVDTTLSFKRWYFLSSIITSCSIAATGIIPLKASNLALLTAIIILSNFFVTFLCMSTEGLMSYDVPEEVKGRAGGFFQAGNLGGAGIGGGLGLWLAQRTAEPWMPAVAIGGMCFLCSIALLFFKDPHVTIREESISKTYRNLGSDVWNTIKTKSGMLGIVLCFLTIGTGAAGGLWSSAGKDWKASADVIAVTTGVIGGLLSAAGCMLGGWICDRMNRRYAYLLFGLLAAAVAVGMAYSPKTEYMFIVWTSIYAIVNGLSFAGFSAFTLEAIGKGAAATKYNIFAALSNSPIYLMTYIDGYAYTRWGPKGMLNTEAFFGVVAVVVFILLQAIINRKPISVTLHADTAL